VPQPLDYLITDAARRHGHVRVRATRSCVIADEALVTEILNTRSLAKLGLAQLNPRLDDAELALLSHAVDNHDDVLTAYRDKNGSHSIRQIRPERIQGRWLESYCHLRGADREFTIANIESVDPAH
jgi:predicted DNA-binding transcriptional regulator YafY